MKEPKVNKTKEGVEIFVNSKMYPLEAVYGAAYVFLDRAYIKLDGSPKGNILVSIKGKKSLNKEESAKLSEEFLNELLSYSLRYQISKDNRKIREYIVGTALLGAAGEETAADLSEGEEDWQKDELGIAVPWEEKYPKK